VMQNGGDEVDGSDKSDDGSDQILSDQITTKETRVAVRKGLTLMDISTTR